MPSLMLARAPSSGHPAGFIELCLPTPASTGPDGSQWAYEIKHDGFRFIARRDGDRVRVFSRRGRDWTDRVPLIVDAMRALPVTSATLDGEGVVVDERGVNREPAYHQTERSASTARSSYVNYA